MIIIGEKINGAIPKTAEAIQNRDSAYIRELAKSQEDAGADYLDVCAGARSEDEYDALCWLIDVVQSAASKPICVDSPDPRMLVKVLPQIKKPGIINSISGEGDKCDVLLPVLRDNPDWSAVALCCDNRGISSAVSDKTNIAFELIEKAGAYGVTPDRLYIDPLVLAVSVVNDGAVNFLDAIRIIKSKYPAVRVTAALSNVSYGMPARGLVNRNFLTLIMQAGIDAIIADPLNRGVIETIYATETLLGRDKLCRNFNKAFRAGKIGPKK
jgi:5-methyltetrahydrofolate--homocysteine methyltransferase